MQFVSSTGSESQPFLFRNHDDRPSSETWHVQRAEFDQMLLQNAREKGADCRDGVRVADVLMEGDRAIGVTLGGRKNQETIRSKVVVDATGLQGLISNKLGIRHVNPLLRKAAIWGHFRGGTRDDSHGGVKTVILHTSSKKSWFWYIPQAEDVVR